MGRNRNTTSVSWPSSRMTVKYGPTDLSSTLGNWGSIRVTSRSRSWNKCRRSKSRSRSRSRSSLFTRSSALWVMLVWFKHCMLLLICDQYLITQNITVLNKNCKYSSRMFCILTLQFILSGDEKCICFWFFSVRKCIKCCKTRLNFKELRQVSELNSEDKNTLYQQS